MMNAVNVDSNVVLIHSAAKNSVFTPFFHPGHMLPQPFLPHPPLLFHHLLPPVSLPRPRRPPLLLQRHHQGHFAAPAEGGNGHWMSHLASAAAPSRLRAAAGKTESSTLNAAGQKYG